MALDAFDDQLTAEGHKQNVHSTVIQLSAPAKLNRLPKSRRRIRLIQIALMLLHFTYDVNGGVISSLAGENKI